MPTTYDEYCQQVLTKMWEESTEHPEDPDERVWQGGLHQLVKATVEKANPGTIMTSLQKSGAVVMLKRGGGQVSSVYWLRREEFEGENSDPYYKSPSEQLESRLNGLNNRLHKLERFVEQFTPLLLEIAAERAGLPSPLQQIAEAFEEASVAEQLGVNSNSTQEDS